MVGVQNGSRDGGPVGRGDSVTCTRIIRNTLNAEPPLVVGVALMTDTDNTGKSAVAGYDGHSLCRFLTKSAVKRVHIVVW